MGTNTKHYTMDIEIKCKECEGEGTHYVDTSGSCTRYIGDCCGGCGHDVDCEDCGGHGTVEVDEYEIAEMKEDDKEQYDEVYSELSDEEKKAVDEALEEIEA
jgi:hypothetical protein